MDDITLDYMYCDIAKRVEKGTPLKDIEKYIVDTYEIKPLLATCRVNAMVYRFQTEKKVFYGKYAEKLQNILTSIKDKPDAQNSTAYLTFSAEIEEIRKNGNP